MYLDIVSPDKNIFSGEVNSVQLPGTAGSFGVLNNHAPLISTLKSGKINIRDNTQNQISFDIKGGVVEVMNNRVIILAEE
jgi:F-type H+-transporting ATPase subunit epsilon